ncbi:unnamed protein product [Amoebophrya sp. A25]|nr:unnamed protein product [Amoebophrya sp. A25]|eukprot:GSA25T00000905001.1
MIMKMTEHQDHSFPSGSPLEDDSSSLGSELQWLLSELRLDRYHAPALTWCTTMGAGFLHEAVCEELADHLQMKPLERRRFLQAGKELAAVAIKDEEEMRMQQSINSVGKGASPSASRPSSKEILHQEMSSSSKKTSTKNHEFQAPNSLISSGIPTSSNMSSSSASGRSHANFGSSGVGAVSIVDDHADGEMDELDLLLFGPGGRPRGADAQHTVSCSTGETKEHIDAQEHRPHGSEGGSEAATALGFGDSSDRALAQRLCQLSLENPSQAQQGHHEDEEMTSMVRKREDVEAQVNAWLFREEHEDGSSSSEDDHRYHDGHREQHGQRQLRRHERDKEIGQEQHQVDEDFLSEERNDVLRHEPERSNPPVFPTTKRRPVARPRTKWAKPGWSSKSHRGPPPSISALAGAYRGASRSTSSTSGFGHYPMVEQQERQSNAARRFVQSLEKEMESEASESGMTSFKRRGSEEVGKHGSRRPSSTLPHENADITTSSSSPSPGRRRVQVPIEQQPSPEPPICGWCRRSILDPVTGKAERGVTFWTSPDSPDAFCASCWGGGDSPAARSKRSRTSSSRQSLSRHDSAAELGNGNDLTRPDVDAVIGGRNLESVVRASEVANTFTKQHLPPHPEHGPVSVSSEAGHEELPATSQAQESDRGPEDMPMDFREIREIQDGVRRIISRYQPELADKLTDLALNSFTSLDELRHCVENDAQRLLDALLTLYHAEHNKSTGEEEESGMEDGW